jgi:hypothetical protein
LSSEVSVEDIRRDGQARWTDLQVAAALSGEG